MKRMGLFDLKKTSARSTRSTKLEGLETRRLFCVDHLGHLVQAPTASDQQRDLAAALAPAPSSPSAAASTPVHRVRLTHQTAYNAVASAVDTTAAQIAAAAVADPVTFSTTASGLPILNSRPDGGGLKVFIDWDGANGDQGFSTDGDLTTFNTAEQAVIYSTWRDIVSAFSMLNVNVTTVQPPTGGSNPAFVWQRITNSVAGGAAYVNWIVNYESHGYNNSDNALYRHSGIYHELGHQLGLDHQSAYDDVGNKTAEYVTGYDTRHGAIMGIDYSGNIKKWYFGRDTYAADSFQDDIADMAGVAGRQTGTDGYRPDDFTGTTLAGATVLPVTNGAYQTAGVISKIDDADIFSFTSTGGSWNVNVEPTFQSPLAPKLEVYNSSGTLISSVDDTLYRAGQDNNSLDLNLNLPAGQYYAKVSSSGNYSDQGEYAFYATPLPSGWTSVDVNRGNTGRGGYVTYDSSNGTFFQGGSGADIWTNTDSFRYSYQMLTGDGSITARVDRLDNTAAFAKAGVMIRQTTAANSAHVYYGIKPSGQLEAIARNTAGATAYNTFGGGSTGPWVRITRVGNLFTIARSADGVTWTNAGSTTVVMTGPVLIGLATCSNNFGAQTTSSFSHVAVTGNTTPATPTYNGLAAPAGLTATTAATQTTGIVLNWADGAGETGYRIERSLDNSTFSSIGTVGADVTSFTDTANGWGSMRYWYRVTALTGSSISAYSDAVSAQNRPGQVAVKQIVKMSPTRYAIQWWDIAGDNGYRVERSSNGGASYTTLDIRPKNLTAYNDGALALGTTYTYRITPLSPVGDGVPQTFTITTQLPATSSISLSNSTSSSLTVNWSAVTNAASYRVYRSTDNENWAQVTTTANGSTVSYTDTGRNALTNYYYYVVAVASDGTLGLNSAVAKGSTAPATPLPSPWLDTDIGGVTGIGKAGSTGAGAFTLNSSGNDIANPDSFHFVYQPFTGNSMIVARVDSLSLSDNAAKAGLMVRQNLTSNTAAYAGIFMNAGNGFGIDVRSRASAGANYQYGQAIGNVAAPYWLKLQRTGNDFLMSYSADGVSWSAAITRTIAMTGTVYIGLATTAQSTALMNVSAFANVAVGLPSAAPTVVNAASATPNPVTGTTTNVSVLGNDDGGEAGLIYGWTATGPAPVTFTNNGTNAGKNSVATFSKAGTYTLAATINDGMNTVTSSVQVVVTNVLNGIMAASGTIASGTSIAITGADQFGDAMALGSGYVWSTSSGSITQNGVFTASAGGTTTATITARSGATTYTTTVTAIAGRAWYAADTSGASLVDSSGLNNQGTLTGAYSYTAGRTGTALTLTGGNATLPSGIVNGLSDFTIAAWVNLTSTAQWSRIFDFGADTTKYMFLTANAGSGVRFAITTTGGSGEQVINGPALSLNTWTHVAVTLVGNVGTLYLDGVAVGTNTAMTLRPSGLGATAKNYLGKSQYADPVLQGRIDDFRILGTGLSASAIVGIRDQWQTPTIATAASASPATVNGTATTVSVLGSSSNGESGLTYTWTVLGTPPADVSFSANGTNAAKNGTATFAASGTYQLMVTVANAAGGSASSTTTVQVTLPPPTTAAIVGSSEVWGVGSHAVKFTFDRDVGTQEWSDLVEVKSADGTRTVTPSSYDYDRASCTVTIGLPIGSAMADGDYILTLKAGAVLADSQSLPFFFFAGDANQDRKIDFVDLLTLAKSYNASGRTFADGDFTGDGLVSFDDLLLLAKGYNGSFAAPVSAAPVGGTSSSTSKTRMGGFASDVIA